LLQRISLIGLISRSHYNWLNVRHRAADVFQRGVNGVVSIITVVKDGVL